MRDGREERKKEQRKGFQTDSQGWGDAGGGGQRGSLLCKREHPGLDAQHP